MASLLLLRRPVTFPLTVGLSFTSILGAQAICRPKPLLCDATAGAAQQSSRSYVRDAKVPVFKGGRPNPAAYRQLSAGSIIGLFAGVAVSTFSRTLAFLLGLGIFGVQWAASRGYNVIPVSRFQKYFQGIDLRSALEDNVAFKLSFGTTFMLAAFAGF